jgi:RimJ/RimL family protein N-acetyltransferase
VAEVTSPWEHRLYTERLRLRVPASHDAEALYDLFTDAEVMQGLGKERVSTVEEVEAVIEGMIDGWRTDGVGAFILETGAPDPQVVGQAGVMIFDMRDWTPSTWAKAGRHAQPELGWALTRTFWGQGYATEAAAAIRDWAHARPGIDRLVSLISPDNVRSQRVAERLGAIPTETVIPAHSSRSTVVWRHQRDTGASSHSIRILVTGMSGTGKSSVLAELGRRGYRVVDTDDPGWREYREDVGASDGLRRGEWLWVEERIAGLLDSDDGRSLFVQGCVRNQSKFYDRFDAVVLLSAPADVILDRIAHRTTNSYGKTPVERAMILDDLARIEPLLRESCTDELDASRPLDQVVADLIAIASRRG